MRAVRRSMCKLHQALEVGQNGQVAARLGRKDALNDLARAASSSTPFARQLRNSCLASRRACLEIFMLNASACQVRAMRNLSGGFLGQAALVFRRQHLAGHRGGGLHDQTADFALEFGQHAGVVLRGGLAGFGR